MSHTQCIGIDGAAGLAQRWPSNPAECQISLNTAELPSYTGSSHTEQDVIAFALAQVWLQIVPYRGQGNALL